MVLKWFFSPKCKISNRDLASCHVAFLLYLDIESVWEGGRGRDMESWVGSNHFSITLLYDKKKKKAEKWVLSLADSTSSPPIHFTTHCHLAPIPWPHSDCSDADVTSGFLLAESSDPFLGPLLLDLSADWTGCGSRGSDLSTHGDQLGKVGPGKPAPVEPSESPEAGSAHRRLILAMVECNHDVVKALNLLQKNLCVMRMFPISKYWLKILRWVWNKQPYQ